MTIIFKLSNIHRVSLEVITIIGCCVSIASLAATIAVLFWFRLVYKQYTRTYTDSHELQKILF